MITTSVCPHVVQLFLNLVGYVRNDLNGAAMIAALPFPVEHGIVNLTGVTELSRVRYSSMNRS